MSCSEQRSFHDQAFDRAWSSRNCFFKRRAEKKENQFLFRVLWFRVFIKMTCGCLFVAVYMRFHRSLVLNECECLYAWMFCTASDSFQHIPDFQQLFFYTNCVAIVFYCPKNRSDGIGIFNSRFSPSRVPLVVHFQTFFRALRCAGRRVQNRTARRLSFWKQSDDAVNPVSIDGSRLTHDCCKSSLLVKITMNWEIL